MSNDNYYYTGSTDLKYYPASNPVNDCFRFTDKNSLACDINIYNNYWQEQIALYGQKIDYYVSGYAISASDALYGEQPGAVYAPPQSLIFGINLNENAILLSKYGLMSDDEVTAFVPITSFYTTFGTGKEPKAGDVFSLVEYGRDRPGARGPNFYEITQRLDQDIAQINPLAGHYVWLIKAKRYEYSFEPGLSGEVGNSQVFEDTIAAGVSGASKPYAYDVDVESKTIFDYSLTTNYDGVYGGY